MRNYVPNWQNIGISKSRYLELYWFCRQFQEWGNDDLNNIQIVEDCARACGEWCNVLIQNVCYGVGYDKLNRADMPTAYRSAFFEARKKFFLLLNQRKGVKKTILMKGL